MSSPTPPKGSLEDLFRHHLLESEAAAVPPRAHVWEQLDNSLLLAQNEKYRRRLLVHRWAVAASLLLAMLAGGGWWHSQQQSSAPPLAQATPTGNEALAARGAARLPYLRVAPTSAGAGYTTGTGSAAAGTPAPITASISSSSTGLAIDQTATLSTTQAAISTSTQAAGTQHRASLLATAGTQQYRAAFGPHERAGRGAAASGMRADARPGALAASSPRGPAAASSRVAPAEAMAVAVTSYGRSHFDLSNSTGTSRALAFSPATVATTTTEASNDPTTTDASSAAVAELASLRTLAAPAALATRPAQVALASTALPNTLGPLPLPDMPAPTLARRWQFGVGYAASAFQPNIDFAKESSSYNPALGPTSAFVTQSAAAEYRSHLRAGLGQRLTLWATRRLGNGRFGLRTGLEVAQSSAYSASSVAFVGEQVADLSSLNYTNAYSAPAPLRTTSYRYRTASVPVEVRYSNPAKSGFSFYGRIGGLFTALLNAHSEVEDNPEAARTYSLMSAGSPYRHLTASLRGGAGVQYRPTGHQWGLSLGPIAEAGILSLNADPIQDFWSQKRPYSFGLEAGVELGRSPRVP